MATNKLVIGMLLIVITIAALIAIINISWKTVPQKCWENLNGSKEDIISALKVCAQNCWSKHDFGKDNTIDDCYTINIFSLDKNIEKKDIETLDKNFKSYLDPVLFKETQYIIKIRYNYTGKEISFVNVGVCGNKIMETNEECENNDSNLCLNSVLFGACTSDSNRECKNCKCYGELDCEKLECKEGIPNSTNPNIDTDWCKFCKQSSEKGNCFDKIDNDCDGLIDGDDLEDCPPCSGPAYLHVDLWAFWYDVRMPLDENQPENIGYPSGDFWRKSLWRCERFNECSGIGGDILSKEFLINKWNELLNYYKNGIHGSCSHKGSDDIECYKNYCKDNGQPEYKCDLLLLDYDKLHYEGCYGYPYGNAGVIKGTSVKVFDENGIQVNCVSTEKDNPFSEHLRCCPDPTDPKNPKCSLSLSKGYVKECGFGACIELPVNKEITIVVRVAPRSGRYPNNPDLPYDYLKIIKFKTQQGKHYIFNATGLYELNECNGPPKELKSLFPGVTCDSRTPIPSKKDIIINIDPSIKLNDNFALLLGSYLPPRYVDFSKKQVLEYAKDVLPQPPYKTIVRTPSPTFRDNGYKDKNFIRTILNFCKEVNCEPMFAVIEDANYAKTSEFKTKLSEFVDTVKMECKNILGHECVYWDIGNEPPNYPHGYNDYSILFANTVPIIKSKIPNAIIFGLETYSHPTIKARDDESKYMVERFLEFLGNNKIDVVQVHWYPNLCNIDGGNIKPEDLIKWTREKERQSISYAKTFPKELYKVMKKYTSSKDAVLGVGEMNPKAACESQRDSSTSKLNEVHAASLWYADVIGILAEEGVKYIQMHALLGPRSDFSLINTNIQQKTPPAYTYEFYSKYFGNIIVSSQSNKPDVLNVHASIDEKNNLYIILINKDQNDKEVTVYIKNYNLPTNIGKVYKLYGSSLSSTDTKIEYVGEINVDQIFNVKVPTFSAVIIQIKK
ncbi:MAG: hypothetical protein QXJ06_02790 [Candidatus Aenigmatarchaeota archaeon]